MTCDNICCCHLDEKKKSWIFVNVLIYGALWILTVIMLGLSILTLFQYLNRGIYHIEFTSFNDTNGTYAVVQDNYNISSCSDAAIVNYHPIPDINSTFIGHNVYSTSLIGLFSSIILISIIGNLLIDLATVCFFIRNSREDAKDKKDVRNRTDKCTGIFVYIVFKIFCNSTYSVPAFYMGFFGSSKACLALNSPLVYEFLFTLWLPTLIVAFVSTLLVALLTIIIIYVQIRSGGLVWNSEKDRRLGTVVACLAVLPLLYCTVIHVIALIPLAYGALNVESGGIIISSLILNVFPIIQSTTELCK